LFLRASWAVWSAPRPDFDLRGLPCKHVFAVEIVTKRETPEGDVLTETVRVTYSQDWRSYNMAQCEEKERFLPMLADLCSTIPNPPQGRGRPRLPMSDMAFACVNRVYEGLSARRFDSDVRDAQAKGLTEADPHFNSVLRYLRSPEMTDVLTRLVEISALPLKPLKLTSPWIRRASRPPVLNAGTTTSGARSSPVTNGSSCTP